jgi:hypothetical protein
MGLESPAISSGTAAVAVVQGVQTPMIKMTRINILPEIGLLKNMICPPADTRFSFRNPKVFGLALPFNESLLTDFEKQT